jgi:hypothetical protein
MKEALDDDLNTAQVCGLRHGAVGECGHGFPELNKDDVPPLLAVLTQFDEIFRY